uniref:XTP/dITP diphosphatase n=1 Tax=Candidatus Methanomethylicus mesodigestus TaxID=1867258 RepID=A0A7C3IT17_9CREN
MGKREILFATGNPHKVEEANRTLSQFGICLRIANCEKVEIQSDSLERIAEHAAASAAAKLGCPVIAEDSGLFIKSLGGFPGPYSSYAFKTIGCSGILRLMEGVSDRRAAFRCSIAYAVPGNPTLLFAGEALGFISDSARGTRGFGFDPIFKSNEGRGLTFAEMEAEEKDRISHRGRAFRSFGDWCIRSEGSTKT